MDREEREKWASQLRPILERATVDRSLRDIAADVGVSHGTLSNLLGGQVPSQRTLKKVERWTKTGQNVYLRVDEAYGDPAGSPAERLIYHFSHPDAVRQLGPSVSPEDRVKAAYAIAIEDGWAEEEINKLDAWRQAVLSKPSRSPSKETG